MANVSRVLVVDDTSVNRLIVEKWLTAEGYGVVLAEDGKEALEELDEERGDRFEAVILDVMMPGIDGITVLKKVRETRSSIELPIIMATAKGESDDVVEALQAGANDYVVKPIDMPVLLARLATQIDLKRSHESLRAAHRSLVHSAKMETVGRLAAGVAHEICNPLAQIQMTAEALTTIEAVKADPVCKELIPIMIEAVGRADDVVKRLMKSASADRLTLLPSDLNGAIEEVLTILEDEIAKAGAQLKLELDPMLPEAQLAPDELRQVLLNVLINALQAMPDGGELAIRTQSQTLEGLPQEEGSRTGNRPRNGDRVCLVMIEDSGPGIPEDQLDTIFDAFFTTRATGDGMGMGLTVAKKLIDLQEGLIAVENREEGAGTRVSICLKTIGTVRTKV